MFIIEPGADNFANKVCQNINAFDRAKVFIAHSAEDALHPTRASKVAK